jgi:putative ABC transport system permease protein
MRRLDRLKMSFLALFRRGRADARLNEELGFHLEQQIAENRAAGMSADEARYAALRTFGNPTVVREQTRASWRWGRLELLGRDVRIAIRTLLRTPGFTLIAIAVMALCLGAATSLFTIVRSVLLKPLPFRDPDKLVMVYEHFRAAWANRSGFNYNSVAPADYYDWRTQTHGFEDIAAWRYGQFNLTGANGDLPEIVEARAGSWNIFPLLGVHAAIGRTFSASEDRSDGNVVLLTWNLFERRFAGESSIVGRQIHLDGKPYTVVGVLPKWFTYPDAKAQIWIPFAAALPPEILKHHDYHFARVVARLRPGVSLAAALAQIEAVQYQLHLKYAPAPVAEDVVSRTLIQDLAHEVKKPLVLLLCAAGCMLLIGCLNIANLLVARGAARQKEVAIRGALGARRLALMRAQMTESLLICAAGGVAGVGLSIVVTKWLAHAWKDLPTAHGFHVDGFVLGFSGALIVLAALLAGLLPAISSTTKSVFATLQTSSRTTSGNLSRTMLRKTLLTIEIAATVVLLIAAGLLLKSFMRLRSVDLGCTANNVLTMRYSLPDQKYDSPEKANAFNEALLRRVSTMPGVRAVAIGSDLPGAGSMEDDIFTIPEHPPATPGTVLPDAQLRMASPNYFAALQIPLLSGRFFTGDDRAGRPKTVIISQQLARQYFQGENPLGKHLHLVPYGDADYEIVGVVGDTLYHTGKSVFPTMYFPVLNGNRNMGLTLAVRTAGDPLALSVPIQKVVALLDPELPVSDVRTMEQIVDESLGNQQFSATLVLAFAVLSLLLASIGLYGVLSYLMTQRMTEIGIRIALGAKREQVVRLMLVDGLRPALFGLGFGLIVSALTVWLIQSMLFGTEPLDPAVFALVAFTLLAVASLACLIPAWRAAHLDPMQALRTE